jgi:ribosomal protein S18 acetylase RimI-like enzyme
LNLDGGDKEMNAQYTLRLAEVIHDIRAVESLAYAAYAPLGYCESLPSSTTCLVQYQGRFNLHPDTATIVAIGDSTPNSIIGTISVSFDGTLGLPVDEEFPEYTNSLRSAGRKIAYIWRLCVDETHRGRAVTPLLFAEAYRLIRARGATAVLAVVHPKHVPLYKEIGFQLVAQKDCARELSKAPAYLLSATRIPDPGVFRDILERGLRGKISAERVAA